MTVVLKEISYDGIYHTPESITIPGQPFCITKGADNIMMELLGNNQGEPSRETLLLGVNILSMKGLRTLMYGYHSLDIIIVENWLEEW